MKMARILWMMLLVLMMTGCGGDDDEAIAISEASIAAMWKVTATNSGNGWVSCDTDDYDAITWLIFSEDGFCMSFLEDCVVSGKYIFANNIAKIYDVYNNLKGECLFTEVNQNSAKAIITTTGNIKIDIRLYRDNRNPLMYRDPVVYLKGRWQMKKSKKYYDDNYVDDTDGTAVFTGNNVTFNIKGETTTAMFYRLAIYSIACVDEMGGRYSLRSADTPNAISVYDKMKDMLMIFERQE